MRSACSCGGTGCVQRGAHLLGRAVLAGKLGKLPFEFLEPVHDGVVLGIADEADALGVVGDPVALDAIAQRLRLGTGSLEIIARRTHGASL